MLVMTTDQKNFQGITEIKTERKSLLVTLLFHTESVRVTQ